MPHCEEHWVGSLGPSVTRTAQARSIYTACLVQLDVQWNVDPRARSRCFRCDLGLSSLHWLPTQPTVAHVRSSLHTSSESVSAPAGKETTRTIADVCFLSGLCRRRGWTDPSYECYRDPAGFTCLVLVNGREYQTDLAYASDTLAQENAAMRAFMVCRNFSVNGGMLARNGIVQGLPANDTGRHRRSRHGSGDRNGRRSGNHSSSSSTTSFD